MEQTRLKDTREARIDVLNINKAYKINGALVKKIVKETLKSCGSSKEIEFEFVFVDNGSIKKLNRIYKKRNAPTDVLAFTIDRREFGMTALLGEAFISLDTARINSRKFKEPLAKEAALYIIHACLHILGYNDESAKDRRRMARKQSEILEQLWKKEDLSKVLTRR